MGATHVYGELPAHPGELGGIRSNLLDATGMGFADMHGIPPQGIDDAEVLLEHVRMLVIFVGDVPLDGIGEGKAAGLAEGQAEDIAGRQQLDASNTTGDPSRRSGRLHSPRHDAIDARDEPAAMP